MAEENNDIKSKVIARVRESERGKEFKDTEVVTYTRKYNAQYDLVTSEDLSKIEVDNVTAYKLIEKGKIWPVYNVEELKNEGNTSGAAYLKVKIREALSSRPLDSKDARETYVRNVETLRNRLTELKDVAAVSEYIKNFVDLDKFEFGVIPSSVSSSNYISTSHTGNLKSYNSRQLEKYFDDIFGKRFISFCKVTTDAAKKIRVEAQLYERFTQELQDATVRMRQAAGDKKRLVYSQILEAIKKTPDDKQALSTAIRAIDQYAYNEKMQKDYLIQKYTEWSKPVSEAETRKGLPAFFAVREDDWSWSGAKKEKIEKATVDELDKVAKSSETIFQKYGIEFKKGAKRTPLDYIKRTGGLSVDKIDVKEVTDKFGYKNVVFGNYVNNQERKENLRHFLGAMLDMHEIINIDVKQINQLGGLDINFGSTGCGAFSGAMACYFRSLKAINLTKKRGDGSIAHEWAHYLDNVLGEGAERRATESHMATNFNAVLNGSEKIKTIFQEWKNWLLNGGTPRTVLIGYPPQKKYKFRLVGNTVEEAIAYVQKTYQSYGKYENHNSADLIKYYGYLAYKMNDGQKIYVPLQTKVSMFYYKTSLWGMDYYGSFEEIFARAFSWFVEDALELKGRVSNYLVDNVAGMGDMAILVPRSDWPFPYEEEDKIFLRDWFDRLFSAMRTEYNMKPFNWNTTERGDEFSEYAPDKNAKVEAGIIVDSDGDTEALGEIQTFPGGKSFRRVTEKGKSIYQLLIKERPTDLIITKADKKGWEIFTRLDDGTNVSLHDSAFKTAKEAQEFVVEKELKADFLGVGKPMPEVVEKTVEIIETPAMKKEFTFMSDNPMRQGKALQALEKKINNEGTIMPFYEMIEGFPAGLKVDTSKIHSRTAESGYVEKQVIGNHIVTYKAEVDYYNYLQAGGLSYSQHLADKKIKADAEAAAQNLLYEEQKKIRAAQASEQFLLQTQAKNKAIKEFIAGGKEQMLERDIAAITARAKANGTDSQTLEMLLEQQRGTIDKNHRIATQLYEIVNGEVEQKYKWKVGDSVMVPGAKGGLIPTVIKEIKFIKTDGTPTYIVEQKEGFYNPAHGYDSVFPAAVETAIKTEEGKVISTADDSVVTIKETEPAPADAEPFIATGKPLNFNLDDYEEAWQDELAWAVKPGMLVKGESGLERVFIVEKVKEGDGFVTLYSPDNEDVMKKRSDGIVQVKKLNSFQEPEVKPTVATGIKTVIEPSSLPKDGKPFTVHMPALGNFVAKDITLEYDSGSFRFKATLPDGTNAFMSEKQVLENFANGLYEGPSVSATVVEPSVKMSYEERMQNWIIEENPQAPNYKAAQVFAAVNGYRLKNDTSYNGFIHIEKEIPEHKIVLKIYDFIKKTSEHDYDQYNLEADFGQSILSETKMVFKRDTSVNFATQDLNELFEFALAQEKKLTEPAAVKFTTVKECLLADGDNANDFIVEGTRLINSTGGENWEVVQLDKKGVDLKHIPASILDDPKANKHVDYATLKEMFESKKITIPGIDSVQAFNHCVKSIKTCLDKIDLGAYNDEIKSQLATAQLALEQQKAKAENIYLSSLASYKAATPTRKAEMIQHVKNELERNERGKTIGFELAGDMVIAANKFLQEVEKGTFSDKTIVDGISLSRVTDMPSVGKTTVRMEQDGFIAGIVYPTDKYPEPVNDQEAANAFHLIKKGADKKEADKLPKLSDYKASLEGAEVALEFEEDAKVKEELVDYIEGMKLLIEAHDENVY